MSFLMYFDHGPRLLRRNPTPVCQVSKSKSWFALHFWNDLDLDL